jgi:hypothetical protein
MDSSSNIILSASVSPPLECSGGSAAVHTAKPVIAGQMQLVQFSLASLLHHSLRLSQVNKQ